ncbi:MAG: hypothetical protein FWF44_01730, partial [Defluviitaleaceae bacterium]|nr:hypothetical protein [Defluviitaleaceae bacterium]
MSRLVFGLDAGGTKTHCALYDLDSGFFDFLTWGQGNHENMPGGFAQLKDELTAMLGTILGRNGLGVEE